MLRKTVCGTRAHSIDSRMSLLVERHGLLVESGALFDRHETLAAIGLAGLLDSGSPRRIALVALHVVGMRLLGHDLAACSSSSHPS